MKRGCQHFRLGAFQGAIVSDGTYAYEHPARMLFADAPHDELASALRAWNIELSNWTTYVSPYPSLVIDTGRETILIDTGAGDLFPSTGQLVPNLKDIGLEPSDIDVVVLTHAHPDHINGVLDREGRPAFSKATYFISRTEWDFWMNEPDLSVLDLPDEFKATLRDCAYTNLSQLADRLELISLDSELLAGVEAFDASGHTPGQIGVRICSDGSVLFAVSDVVAHPIHIRHPEWSAATDYWPEVAANTRRRILSRAVVERARIFAYHFPEPGLGQVEPDGSSWRWRPCHDSSDAWNS